MLQHQAKFMSKVIEKKANEIKSGQHGDGVEEMAKLDKGYERLNETMREINRQSQSSIRSPARDQTNY